VRAKARLLSLLAVLCVASASAFGQTEKLTAEPLLPDEVLASSALHFPGILKSLAEQRVAQGKAVEAEGAFDTVFSSDAFNRLNGFYDGRVAGAKVTRPFREFGGELYGDYSVSRGDFPIYEDQYFTSTDGTVKVGALFSLLRDRAIDARRVGVMDARLDIQEAELELMLTRVGVQQRALRAYWRWVAAGRQLAVYDELLRLAIDREAGLERQVQDGSRARIFLTENAQNLTRRRTLVVSAQRDFRSAAFELSFYLRDPSGEISLPPAARLPAPEQIAQLPPVNSVGVIEQSIARRPELKIVDTALQRAQQRIALSENELKPRVDLNFEYAYGLGDQGEGGPSKDSEDFIVGFTVEVPLERRFAKGRIAQERARQYALEFERQQLEDQIELELQNILLDLDVAQELSRLAGQEVEQAEIMRDAERARFDQGASDFFLVNLREETAANALIRYYAAIREARVARANYDAATVNMDQLGLADTEPSIAP
jgi:outer membrane protein TolC